MFMLAYPRILDLTHPHLNNKQFQTRNISQFSNNFHTNMRSWWAGEEKTHDLLCVGCLWENHVRDDIRCHVTVAWLSYQNVFIGWNIFPALSQVRIRGVLPFSTPTIEINKADSWLGTNKWRYCCCVTVWLGNSRFNLSFVCKVICAMPSKSVKVMVYSRFSPYWWGLSSKSWLRNFTQVSGGGDVSVSKRWMWIMLSWSSLVKFYKLQFVTMLSNTE